MYIKMDTTTTVKKRRSVRLSNDEHKSLRSFIKRFDTLTEASEAIGISREVLTRVQILGSSSPDTIEKIRAVIIQDSEAA